MKKTYNSPALKVVKLNTVHMTALSTQTFNESNGKSGVVLGREDNSWDIWGGDDYDDEY